MRLECEMAKLRWHNDVDLVSDYSLGRLGPVLALEDGAESRRLALIRATNDHD